MRAGQAQPVQAGQAQPVRAGSRVHEVHGERAGDRRRGGRYNVHGTQSPPAPAAGAAGAPATPAGRCPADRPRRQRRRRAVHGPPTDPLRARSRRSSCGRSASRRSLGPIGQRHGLVAHPAHPACRSGRTPREVESGCRQPADPRTGRDRPVRDPPARGRDATILSGLGDSTRSGSRDRFDRMKMTDHIEVVRRTLGACRRGLGECRDQAVQPGPPARIRPPGDPADGRNRRHVSRSRRRRPRGGGSPLRRCGEVHDRVRPHRSRRAGRGGRLGPRTVPRPAPRAVPRTARRAVPCPGRRRRVVPRITRRRRVFSGRPRRPGPAAKRSPGAATRRTGRRPRGRVARIPSAPAPPCRPVRVRGRSGGRPRDPPRRPPVRARAGVGRLAPVLPSAVPADRTGRPAEHGPGRGRP